MSSRQKQHVSGQQAVSDEGSVEGVVGENALFSVPVTDLFLGIEPLPGKSPFLPVKGWWRQWRWRDSGHISTGADLFLFC